MERGNVGACGEERPSGGQLGPAELVDQLLQEQDEIEKRESSHLPRPCHSGQRVQTPTHAGRCPRSPSMAKLVSFSFGSVLVSSRCFLAKKVRWPRLSPTQWSI